MGRTPATRIDRPRARACRILQILGLPLENQRLREAGAWWPRRSAVPTIGQKIRSRRPRREGEGRVTRRAVASRESIAAVPRERGREGPLWIEKSLAEAEQPAALVDQEAGDPGQHGHVAEQKKRTAT